MAGRSAFVIDDSKSARFALRRYLESMQFVVETAESAEVAFNYLKDHHPDVIFLDHVMPGVDGFDVLNSIKSDPRTIDIPVIICSSNEGDAFTQEAKFKGAVDVLTKPPTPQQLARVLGSLQPGAAKPAPAPAARPATPAAAGAPAPTHGAQVPQTAQPSPAPVAAAAAIKPADSATVDRLAKLVEDLARHVGELKAQIAKLEGRHEGQRARGGFPKFRAHALKTKKPRLVSGSRKLPRR